LQLQHGPQPAAHPQGRLAPSARADVPRAALPFRAVNRPGGIGHDAGLQRHHLLPRQLVGVTALSRLFDRLGRESIGFDDFRRNGLLLPASEQAARILGLPLHRGPHRAYNAMVFERVGRIESDWASHRLRAPDVALDEALMRLTLLQGALRRRLLAETARLRLNRGDPLGAGRDFTELDAMAERLWRDTAP